MDYAVTLPNGEVLAGEAPIVVIGPNGSGKTRQTRNISSPAPMEFINALRNTRVAPELPAVGVDTATSNFNAQKQQARSQHWELTSEFDSMLSKLLAQESMAAIEFTHRFKADPSTAGQPEVTPLTQVERLWGEVFPGRELHWRDWKPLVTNATGDAEVQYSANAMSDGEKAALFVASRVFSTEQGILVVDEPETHFHSLLAVRLWNALEDARPDLRFVYVTHDLTFAMSRRNARYVLSSPTAGLRPIDVDASLPEDVAGALLGSASLSFYASRVVFCEGEESGRDAELYGAWFKGPDTVVKAVGSCDRVLRCVDALGASGIAQSLTAIGILDGDYHADAFKGAMPSGVAVLDVHEVESLFCLPAVVSAVCTHVSQPYDEASYRAALVETVNDQQRHRIIIERWKAHIEPHLNGLVAGVAKNQKSVDDLVGELPAIFDHTQWPFSPADLLNAEKTRVEEVVAGGSIEELLQVAPGKQMLSVAARLTGMSLAAYQKLVTDALRGRGPEMHALGEALAAALRNHLPDRHVAVAQSAAPVEPQ